MYLTENWCDPQLQPVANIAYYIDLVYFNFYKTKEEDTLKYTYSTLKSHWSVSVIAAECDC